MNQDFKEEILQILPVLASGGIILYPTDTIWGLGCDALDWEAAQRISVLKQQPIEKKPVLLVSSIEMLEQYVNRVHPRLYSLHEFHQRPVTVIYENAKNLPEGMLSEDGTVAIRITKDEFCKQLINTLGKPIVSTSASISNEPFPETFNDVSNVIREGVDYIVKYRRDETTKNIPSVILKLGAKEELEFLRE